MGDPTGRPYTAHITTWFIGRGNRTIQIHCDKRINRLRNVTGRPIWQRNYYEHIIRNEHEMDRITRYIESNPTRWAEDEENPDRIDV